MHDNHHQAQMERSEVTKPYPSCQDLSEEAVCAGVSRVSSAVGAEVIASEGGVEAERVGTGGQTAVARPCEEAVVDCVCHLSHILHTRPIFHASLFRDDTWTVFAT